FPRSRSKKSYRSGISSPAERSSARIFPYGNARLEQAWPADQCAKARGWVRIVISPLWKRNRLPLGGSRRTLRWKRQLPYALACVARVAIRTNQSSRLVRRAPILEVNSAVVIILLSGKDGLGPGAGPLAFPFVVFSQFGLMFFHLRFDFTECFLAASSQVFA